jgi:hypothetical protein
MFSSPTRSQTETLLFAFELYIWVLLLLVAVAGIRNLVGIRSVQCLAQFLPSGLVSTT